MKTLFSYAKNSRKGAIWAVIAGFALALSVPITAGASPVVLQDSGTGDVCDVCSLSFSIEDCDAKGGVPYDSVEQNPDGSDKYPDPAASQPVADPKPAATQAPTPKATPKPAETSAPKSAPASTPAAPKPNTSANTADSKQTSTQAPAVAPPAEETAASGNSAANPTSAVQSGSSRGAETSASRSNPGESTNSAVAVEDITASASSEEEDTAGEAAEEEITPAETEAASADLADESNEDLVAAQPQAGGSTSGAGLLLLGGLVLAAGAGLGVHYLRKSGAATN